MGEFLPKTIFIISPNFFLKILSTPALFFYYLFYPISKLTLIASNLFIKIFFGSKADKKDQENLVFSRVDLNHFMNLGNKTSKETEPYHHNIRIFQNALDFSSVKLQGMHGSKD